jgi:prepilin-type N-terminal cleavage/methylation domain-containing protein
MKRILSRSPRLHGVRRGFTLVELVVVVFIIAVLAALTVVAYGNFTGQARDKAVLSDLDHLDTLETNLEIHNNGVPETWYSGSGADAALGFTPSPGDLIDIVANSTNTGYCIRGWNPNSASYKTINTVATKENPSGTCAANPPSAAAQVGNGYIPGPNGGNVSTLATGFNYPTGMSLDPSGALDVINANTNTINKVTTAGVVTVLASGIPGSSPWGITTVPNGTIYYTDTYGETIDQLTTGGVTSVFAGGSYGSTNGVGTAAKFSRTIDVTSDSAGNLYVADLDNNLVRKIITSSALVSTLAGVPNMSGSNDGPGATAKFSSPYGLAADSSGNIYVADSYNDTIRKITPAGVVSTLAGIAGTTGSNNGPAATATFNFPSNVGVDSAGNVYVLDCNNNLVREITPAGVVSTLAGSGASGSANGNGTAASFNGLSGIVVTSGGTVYVSEYGNNDIRKIQ